MTNQQSIQLDMPRLTICWLRALHQIQTQMALGCNLRNSPIHDDQALASAREQCVAWLQDTSAMLLGIFGDASVAVQYNTMFGAHSMTNPAVAATQADFTRGINIAITGLWSLMQRLEFIPDPVGQRGIRWLAVQLIHESVRRRQMQAYYLPS